jgi:tetratricopeptide (TPR) repeat protein
MTEPMANKIGVANLGTVYSQTNHITIQEGQQVALIYSDPLADLRFFQGRGTELSDLNLWLADRSISAIGIRGEGGIGKSTLAAKAFANSLGFAGKFWADVRTGTSIMEWTKNALQELGVPPNQVQAIEEKDLILRLLRHLQMGRYLLAIDNLESVLTKTGEWQSGYELFLDGFLESSQSVLLLAGREFPPKYFSWRGVRWLTVENGLEPLEGAALLAALEVEDSDENRADLSEQVQGNPLALSLIAGWLRQYRPRERTIAQLRQHNDLFQLEGRHRGESNISVERVLQWSIDRLTSAQQHLLIQVSVLRGAFSTETVAALAAEPSIENADLEDLERRSLLQILPERDKAGLTIFRLQPRLREFVQRHAADLNAAHERAIDYFWKKRQTKFAPDDTQAAVNEYEETFYHQCQLGRYTDATATVDACTEFLHRRGYHQTLVDLYNQLHTDWPPTPDQKQAYAVICNNLGGAYRSLGQYQQAINLLLQSLVICREIGDRNGEAASLGNLGNAYKYLGKYQQAIDYYLQSLAITHKIGDCNSEAASLNNLGGAYRSLGQYQQAINYHQQSLVICREIGNRNIEASSLGNLGNAYQYLGQYQQAIDYHLQSLVITHEIGDRNGEADALGNLGNVYKSLGQYQQAINFSQQSLMICREIGDRNGEADTLGNLGNAYRSLGQYQQAINYHQQSFVICREIDDRNGEADSLGNLGNTYVFLGQYQQAINYYLQSLAIQREICDRWGEGGTLLNMGTTLSRIDRHSEALQSYQQALAIYEELKLDHMVAQCKAAIAELS